MADLRDYVNEYDHFEKYGTKKKGKPYDHINIMVIR